MVARALVAVVGCLLAAAIGACAEIDPPVGDLSLVQQSGLAPGATTGRLLGVVCWPEPAESAPGGLPGGAEAQALDLGLRPIGPAVPVDDHGYFTLDGIPAGGIVTVRVTRQQPGDSISLVQVSQLVASLQCTRVDLASTLLVHRILGPEPGIAGAIGVAGPDLLALIRSGQDFEAAEAALRSLLEAPASEPPREIVDQLLHARLSEPARVGGYMDTLRADHPDLEQCYQRAFQDTMANLVLRVEALGENHQPGPRFPANHRFECRLSPPPAGTSFLEFWFSRPIRRALGRTTAASHWSWTLDTSDYPDGSYTLEIVRFREDGRRVRVGSVGLDIDNRKQLGCRP